MLNVNAFTFTIPGRQDHHGNAPPAALNDSTHHREADWIDEQEQAGPEVHPRAHLWRSPFHLFSGVSDCRNPTPNAAWTMPRRSVAAPLDERIVMIPRRLPFTTTASRLPDPRWRSTD